MKISDRYRHFVAITCAAILVFVFKIGSFDVQKIVGPINGRWLQVFTPYFPGIFSVETHEIFSPEFKNYKKIVVIGSSVADSIGCDSTWSIDAKAPNAHYSCSIAYQMDALIQEKGIKGWRVFNLARNGSTLTPMMYVYSQLINLQPEIVIYGDRIGFYMAENAGAGGMNADLYADMEHIFGADPGTSELWRTFFEQLKSKGLKVTLPTNHVVKSPEAYETRESISLNTLLDAGLDKVKNQRLIEEVPPPPVIKPLTVNKANDVYVNRDADFRYMAGLGAIAAMQTTHHRKFLFYFSPQAEFEGLPNINNGIESDYGRYAEEHHFGFSNYLSLHLEPGLESYDGTHQTLYGNKKIAAKLVDDLISRKYLN